VYVYAELQYAELLMAQNKTNESLEICERIYTLAKQQDAKMLEIQASRILGQNKFQIGECESAITLLKQSIEIANSMGIEHEEALSIIAYTAVVIESQNVTPETIKLISHAVKILTKIGAKLDLEEARKLAAKLQKIINIPASI
jgi:tetratricopeptide (TPR) repeat protein